MVYVDIEKCAGCGVCAEACSVGAISLVGGTAKVDQEKCTDCEACVEVCPNKAMLAVREPVEEQAAVPSVLRPAPEAIGVKPQGAPVPLQGRAPFVGSALAFLGRQIVPRLATGLVNALDRRLSGGTVGPTGRGRGLRRRRRRGRGRR